MSYVSISILSSLSGPLSIILKWTVLSQLLFAALSIAKAHELWIESARPVINENNQIQIDIRLGQMFSGASQYFIPERAVLLKLISAEGQDTISPRPGNQPAISFPASKEFDHIVIAYETIGFYLTYTDWNKFIGFATDKRATNILDQHIARNLSKKNFKERYKRFAKTSLFMHSASKNVNDAASGMEIEFIITDVRFIDDTTQLVTLLLIYQGRPLSTVPVTLFTRLTDGEVIKTDLMTDDNGFINLNSETGHDYMLDHVLFRAIPAIEDPKGAVWETLWASYTFSGVGQIND